MRYQKGPTRMPEYTKVLKKGELPEGAARCVEVKGRRIAVFNAGGTFYALDDLCSHDEAYLSEGRLTDGEVECPQHGSRFDLKTGKPRCLPAVKPVKAYPVRVTGEDVEIEVG
jgi:3-phenylpropionate/trans-cinnamate dioxygenase ferredoxin subunit